MFTRKNLSTAEIFGLTQSKSATPQDLFTASGASAPRLHECFYDENSEGDLPCIIVPHNDDQESFFADVATYYPSWSPISAHVHVVNSSTIPHKSTLTRTRKAKTTPSIKVVAPLKFWSSLAFTEAASIIVMNRLNDKEPTYALCRRTLTFSLARSGILYPNIHSSKISEKWNMLPGSILAESSAQLFETIRFLAGLLRSEGIENISDRFLDIRAVLGGGSSFLINDKQICDYLLEFHPHIADSLNALSGDFDGRMDAFQKIVETIQDRPHSNLIDTVTIAFFANRILVGSMRYIKVLSRYLGMYDSLLVWYGFFSACSERYSVESVSLPIDRKLQRDISRVFDFRMTPEVDISIDEFLVLARVGMKPTTLRPLQARTIFLSLLPGVNVFVKMGEQLAEPEQRDAEILQNFQKRDQLLTNLLIEAQRLLSNSPSNEQYSGSTEKYRYGKNRF
ncbi:hypothetical protein [Janthinobacterium sp. BJB301]|uniref:hypothetical protein n=1 Tax=Janthinobacterium sp. BJB301 TaxID=1560195 RepID=UPI00117AD468|nr:hypothetical protein [Janthinobacterium sp. BJB301]